MLGILDIVLAVFHLLLMAFNLTGWIWRGTRKLHLLTLVLTAASWLILGIWYGLGYCPLTDWHWNVKTKMGETGLPASFVKYYADKWTGKDISADLVEQVTVYCLVFAVLASLVVNLVLPILAKRKRNRMYGS